MSAPLRGLVIEVKGHGRTVEAVGYQGKACAAATSKLLGALAPSEIGEHKPEWNEVEADSTQTADQESQQYGQAGT